ncbi:MAG: hypothetical protein LBH74_04195 [Nitrososphaerota archaeon]|jgi:hypothetical protein|uniref:hypothetical protein n=1 Tax=Candidatus Bathycorpusculum sp. TaxID=2994959 RepID=UPI00282C68FD|nr:hypothetical protein [Candidatus Termitimicrobium sp.]MCL2431053.1 hypothetical protein [Candidatus Termitimicrobium sp.]MDR0492823.1 hypothetical protein [Nitrososphaerota archaeon]
MSTRSLLQQKIETFDKTNAIKYEVNLVLGALKGFRQKFPFAENLASIEWLDPDSLFKVNPDEVGEFFDFLGKNLNLQGTSIQNNSNVYRNARLQIKDLKNLLRTTVDDRKSLAQKVDAPWERIGGFGQDKGVAKKIIYCFNYEKGTVLPVFGNQHLRHFVNRTVGTAALQVKYLSLGQEYEHYTAELLKAKNSFLLTQSWDTLYFARFLYQAFPPPDSESTGANVSSERRVGMVVTDEQLDLQGFMKLLGELQKQSKLTGEQFRAYRDLWIRQPSEREALIQRLKKLVE